MKGPLQFCIQWRVGYCSIVGTFDMDLIEVPNFVNNRTKAIAHRDEREEQHEHPSAAAANSAHLEMPQDGHDWKKYGQKYIHNIKKIRSYFKCKNKSCKAKKRVEWHPSSPSHLRIVYDGAHDHRSKYELDQDLSLYSIANQYDLNNQVFGQFDGTS